MKQKSELLKVTILCSCGKEIILNHSEGVQSQIMFSGSESECDVCGSHGSVDISYTCPECQKNKEIRLKSW